MSIISPICGYSKPKKKSKRISGSRITPQLNAKVLDKTIQILKEKGIKNASKKEFRKANDQAIKFYGYTPQYYKKIMKEIGSGEIDDDFYEI